MASSKINIDLVLNTKGFRPLGRINGQLGEFEKSLDASNARVLAFGASAGAILAVRKAFTATIKSAVEVEKALTDINVILRTTSAGLKKFGSDLFQVASQTGQSFAVAAEAAGELARQGLGLTETLKRTRDALILSRLAGMDAVEAVNALTAAMNTFNQAGLDSTTIINKLANVDAAFAVSSDDLAKALGRVGASAKGAGVSFDELLAIVTVAQQKTARGGAVIGNSFKTIFTRIQRPRVIKELENLGVAVRDVSGDVLPAMKVLNNLAKTFDVLTAAQKSAITELVGGVFQVNILKAAMADLSAETGIYGRALSVSNNATDQAMRRNEELNKTLSAQFNKTVNSFKEAAAELGTMTFGPALQNLFSSVEKMESMGKTPLGKVGTSIAKSIFEGIGKFISGPGLAVIGLVLFKTFSQLGKFAADAFKTLTGLNKNLQNQMSLQRQIFDVLSENPDLMKKIEDGTISVEEAHEEIYKQIEKNTGALDKQLMVSNALAKSLGSGGVMFSPDFGATTGGTRDYGGRKGKSFGYVPNFLKDREELMGMVAGGYSRQQVSNAGIKDTTIHDGRGGSFRGTINSHESVINTKNQDGKKATFVVPPKGTDAYKKYMSALSGGFVPNFLNVTWLKGGRASASLGNVVKGQTGSISNSQVQSLVDKGFIADPRTTAGKKGLTQDQFRERFMNKPAGKGTATRAQLGYKRYEMGGKYGLYSLHGPDTDYGAATATTNKITAFNEIPNIKGLPKPPGIVMFGVQYKRALKGAPPSKKGAKNVYSDYIRKYLGPQFMNMSADFANNEMGLPVGTRAVSAGLKEGGAALFPVGAEGSMFEATVNAVTKDKKLFDEGLREDESETFDFRKGSSLEKFKSYAGFSTSLNFADAKRTNDKKSRNSLVNKIYNQARKPGKGRKPEFIQDLMALRVAAGLPPLAKGFVPSFNLTEGYPEEMDSFSRGFIPNFNALWEAVRRERDGGVPVGKIRIGRSDRLKGAGNPAGYGVYNTRDEPMGLSQGINNSMVAGIDPKKKGAAGGFVPSFKAKGGTGGLEDALNKNTAATKSADMTGGKTLGVLFLAQQAITGLENVVGESNNVTKNLIGQIGQMITTFIALQYVMSGMEKKMGLTGTQGFLSGKKDTDRIKSEKEFFFRKRKEASENYKTQMKRARTMDRERAGATGPDRGGRYRSSARTKLIRARARTGKAMADATYGKGGIGPGGRKAGGGVMGKVMKFGAGRALGAAGLAYSAVKGIGHMATKTDLSATFKEQRLAAKAYEKVAAETEKNIGHLTKYGQAAQRAADVINDTNSTVGQVMQANQEMADAMKDLPSKFKHLVAGEIDVKKIQAAIEVATEEQQKAQMNAQARTDAATNLEKNRDSTGWDFMASPFSSSWNWLSTVGTGDANIKGLTKEERDIASDENRKQGKNVVARLNQNSLRDADLQRTFLETAAEGDETEVARMAQADILAKGMRMSDEDAAITMKQAKTGGQAWEEYQEGLREAALADQANLRIAKAMEPALKAMQKALKEEEMAVRDHAEELAREQKVRSEVLKITNAAAGAFLTSVGQIELATQTKITEAKGESEKKFGGQVLNVRTARAAASEAFTATAGMRQTGTDIESILSRAEAGGVGSVDEKETNAAIQQVDKRIEELKNIDQDASDEDKRDAKVQQKQLEALQTLLRDLHGNSERGVKEQKQAVEGIKQVAEAQKLAARQAVRLKAFGGAQALLDPTKLNPVLKQLRGGQMGQIAAQRGGSQMGMDRARINELKAMQDLFGGELPPELQKEATQKAEKIALVQMEALNKRTGGHMSQEFIQKAAKEQAHNLFKGTPIEENTKALESLTKAIETRKELEEHTRSDIVDVGKKRAEAGARKDVATTNYRTMLEEERKKRRAFSDGIEEDVQAVEEAGGHGNYWQKRSKRKHKVWEISQEKGVGHMGGKEWTHGPSGTKYFDPSSFAPERHTKIGNWWGDWAAKDDYRDRGVVFGGDGLPMDLGTKKGGGTAASNPYSQAAWKRMGGMQEGQAEFAQGGMFDPDFKGNQAAPVTTTNNNEAVVSFNITDAGWVQLSEGAQGQGHGKQDMVNITSEQWENIERAVAEGKRRSDAIVKSLENTEAGRAYLKEFLPESSRVRRDSQGNAVETGGRLYRTK